MLPGLRLHEGRAQGWGASMSQAHSFYEGHSFYQGLIWWFVMARIGQGLRARYQVPKELPPKLWALVVKLDAAEGNYLLRYFGSTPDRSADDPSDRDLLFPSASWHKDEDLFLG
jgi:hypothetical protein